MKDNVKIASHHTYSKAIGSFRQKEKRERESLEGVWNYQGVRELERIDCRCDITETSGEKVF